TKAYQDMYRLGTFYTANDVSIPIVGGELLVEFRRTLAIDRIKQDEDDMTFANEEVLGHGWESTLGARLMITRGVSGQNRFDQASIVDEVGNSYQYFRIAGANWIPDTLHSINNESRKHDFTGLVFTKLHGTEYHFEFVFADDCRDVEYYRLGRVRDRLGNEVHYRYPAADSVLPSIIGEYKNGGFTSKKLIFSYDNDKLRKITDPLGREWNYSYASNNLLQSVGFPHTPDGGRSIRFEYDVETRPNEYTLGRDGQTHRTEENRWIMPRTITNGRNHPTRYTYKWETMPESIRDDGVVSWIDKRPRIASVETDDGTAWFGTEQRGDVSATTVVTNTLGDVTRYTFGGRLDDNAPNLVGYAIYITDLTRESYASDNDLLGSVDYTYSADPEGNLLEVRDLSGNLTTYDYGSLPRFNQVETRTVDVGGLDLVTRYTYGSFRRMTRREDAEGRTTTFVHDPAGNLIQKIEPLRKVTHYIYATDGFMTRSIDPDGRKTDYTRDFHDYVLSSHLTGYAGELSIRTTTRRDVINRVHTTIDPNGNTTRQSWDDLDRLIAITHPPVESAPGVGLVNPVTTYRYDANDNRIEQIDPNGVRTTYAYDTLDRQTNTTLHMGGASNIVHLTHYNDIGLVTSETDPRGNETTFSYDALLRLTEKVYPTNITESYTYTVNFGSGAFALSGWVPTTVVNPRGCVTVNTYDGAYRLEKTVRSSCGNTAGSGNPTVHYTYDNVHNRTSQRVENTDCNGNAADQITDYQYDALYRLTAEEVQMPNGNFVTAFTYDRAGNRTSVTDAEGHTTDYVIDGAHRQVEIIQPTVPISVAGGASGSGRPTVIYEYDNNGNITEETDPNGNRTQNAWDALNRKSSSTLDLNRDGNFGGSDDIRTQFHYDLITHLIRKVDPRGSEWDYGYDNAYRLTTETAPAVEDEENGGMVRPITTTEYDQNSNVTGIVDPRGVRTEYGYDALNRRTSETKAVGTAVEVVTTTMYDNNGNIDSLT
ncbi:MAG: hypothetical protein AAF492_05470, partial [Verrucomicrobiota bacterium]